MLSSTRAPRFLSFRPTPHISNHASDPVPSNTPSLCSHITAQHKHTHHICTPQNPFPPHTPRPPAVGAQLRLLTSKPHSHTAEGPRSVPVALGGGACELTRSHKRTQQSSPPLANTPLFVLLHSMVLTFAPCPLSSSNACPGCLTSSTRIRFESCENVASRCASCGEAAIRSNGGATTSVAFEPDPRVGDWPPD